AGNDVFSPHLVDQYFGHLLPQFKISLHDLLGLGRQNPNDHSEPFCLTVLAIRLANVSNGVSALHGKVSRKMWKAIWPDLPDPEALTIGFARRFATYKRGTLLFRNLDRLTAMITSKDRPVQIIFSGKAHPRDHGGKELIAEILHVGRRPELRRRIVFLEDYDIGVARYLVQGIDIWLNNPRRPLEASGTSGMKAACNGGLNLSVLDGGWEEGC